MDANSSPETASKPGWRSLALWQSQNLLASVLWLSQVGPSHLFAVPLVEADPGAPYTASLSATGGVPPYQWSLTSGSLPSGMQPASLKWRHLGDDHPYRVISLHDKGNRLLRTECHAGPRPRGFLKFGHRNLRWGIPQPTLRLEPPSLPYGNSLPWACVQRRGSFGGGGLHAHSAGFPDDSSLPPDR